MLADAADDDLIFDYFGASRLSLRGRLAVVALVAVLLVELVVTLGGRGFADRCDPDKPESGSMSL